MGVSIDLKIYDKNKLLKELSDWGATDAELTIKILEKCGHFFGENYVLLNNEYTGDYSPYYNVATLFDSAFDKEDSFDIFLHAPTVAYGINYVDAEEVADELGITLKEDGD